MAACFKLFAGLIFVLAAGAVNAAEENAVPGTEARIAELVKQLDNDDFALREAAVNELIKIGPAAAASVAGAAQGESLEAATRAFTILDKWLTADEAQQAAAREQLGKLAQEAEEKTATRRAKALLNRQETIVAQPSTGIVRGFLPVAPAAAMRVGVGRVELRAMAQVAGGVGGRTVAITIGDGKKTLNVAEGDFKAQIIEDAKEGIKITTTTKDKAGKEKKTEYAAKNLEELKEKHPEGHKVYEKYAGALNQLKIKMEVGGIQIGPAVEAKAEAVPLTPEQVEKIKVRRAEILKGQAEAKARLPKEQAELEARNEEVMREVEKMRAKLKKERKVPQAEQPKPAEEKDPLFD